MVRGRPKSTQTGAAEIVHAIKALKDRYSISDNNLSALTGIPQSGISRALGRKPPVVTPTLTKLNEWIKANAIIRENGDLRVIPRLQSRADGEEQIAAKAQEMWDGSDTGLANVLKIMDAIRELVRPSQAS